MTIKSEREPRAKQMFKEGILVKKIAELLGVNRRTLQRWMNDWSPEELQKSVPNDPASNQRMWPGWTIDDLTDLPGFDKPIWEQNLMQIEMAVKDNNRLTPWFFRRLIEFGKRYPALPNSQVNWAWAVAGLPPIGEWLGDDGSCAELADVIEEYKPWEWRRITLDRDKVTGLARRTYLKATKELSERIRDRIRIVSAQQSEINPDSWFRAGSHIAAFHERIPVFDRHPRGSRFKGITLGATVRGILVKELSHVS